MFDNGFNYKHVAKYKVGLTYVSKIHIDEKGKLVSSYLVIDKIQDRVKCYQYITKCKYYNFQFGHKMLDILPPKNYNIISILQKVLFKKSHHEDPRVVTKHKSKYCFLKLIKSILVL